MDLPEFKIALDSARTWDEQMAVLGRAWKTAQKKYYREPAKLYYAWEELISAYEERDRR